MARRQITSRMLCIGCRAAFTLDQFQRTHYEGGHKTFFHSLACLRAHPGVIGIEPADKTLVLRCVGHMECTNGVSYRCTVTGRKPVHTCTSCLASFLTRQTLPIMVEPL